MNIKELRSELDKLLPFKDNKEWHFKKRLKYCLNYYLVCIDKLEINSTLLPPKTKQEIKKICDRIINIVTSSMKGNPSMGFNQLQRLLNSKDEGALLNIEKLLITIPKKTSFYRMRVMDSIYEVSQKEFFHIPLTKRDIIRTQRYSILGYPCLYLGKSIYGCWEEMKRPNMQKAAVSRFVNCEELNFLNLCLQDLDFNIEESLKLIPIIIACMIRVANDEAMYKPEYIFPQLLMEWVLKNRKFSDSSPNDKKEIHGIQYFSTHYNNEFDFPCIKSYNYAIPVFSVDMRYTYCKKLTKLFEFTMPTTNEIEKLKNDYPIDCGSYGLETTEERLEENYSNSNFGNLETRLEDETHFPLKTINYKK